MAMSSTGPENRPQDGHSADKAHDAADVAPGSKRSDRRRERRGSSSFLRLLGLMLLLGTAALCVFLYRQTQIEVSRLQAASARAILDRDPAERSTQAALKAATLALAGLNAGEGMIRPGSREAATQLRKAAAAIRLRQTLEPRPPQRYITQFSSPQGPRLLTHQINPSRAFLWGIPMEEPIATLEGLPGFLTEAWVNPSGTRLVTWTLDPGSLQIWDTADAGLLTHFKDLDAVILEAILLADDTRAVAFSADGKVRLLDTASAEEVALLADQDGGLAGIEPHPDGSQVVVWFRDTGATLWAADTGEKLGTFNHPGGLIGARFSPDGARLLTWAFDGSVHVWRMDTRVLEAVLQPADTSPQGRGAAFSPGGKRILTWDQQGGATLWDTETLSAIAALPDQPDGLIGAVFLPDGTRFLTWTSSGAGWIWDARTGAPVERLNDGRNGAVSLPVRRAGHSPDGSLFWTAHDTGPDSLFNQYGPIRLWDGWSGALQAVFDTHETDARRVIFSADGRSIVTTDTLFTFYQWDGSLPHAQVHTSRVTGAAFARDGAELLTWSVDGTARRMDAASGRSLGVMEHAEPVYGGTYDPSPDPSRDRILTLSDGFARIHDRESGAVLATIGSADEPVTDTLFSPDGALLLTTSPGGRAQIHDARDFTLVARFTAHTEGIQDAMFSADGTRLLTWTYDDEATVWNTRSGTVLAALEEVGKDLNILVLTPDGSQVFAWRRYGEGGIWDAASGKRKGDLVGHASFVRGAIISPDGAAVLTWSSDTTARLFNARTGINSLVFSGHEDRVLGATFSPDGAEIMTWSQDGSVRLWDSATGEGKAVFDGHGLGASAAAYSPDGRFVLTGAYDGVARLWNRATGALISVLDAHDRPVEDARFSADGRIAMTRIRDGAPRLWNVAHYTKSAETLTRELCASPLRPHLRLEAWDASRLLGDRNHPDADPCARSGPLSLTFWRDLAGLSEEQRR